MIIKTVKNAGFFLTIFILILGINLGGINNGFTIMSFAQETGEMGEAEGILETDEAQETLATEDTMGAEEIDQAEGEAEAETEEELNISLIGEYITYEKIEDEDLIIAKDGVEFKYQDIEINTDYLKINLTTNLLFASGKIYFLQDETETYCEELTYNWETKKIILLRLKGEITGEGIKGKVYYQGERMENFPETTEISGGSFTTCELEEPHYRIVAKEMIIYPKDKIIARNISWYEGKIKIITLPYFLIFLDRKTQQPILPKIGQNSADGWFIKTYFNYYSNDTSYGTLYIDWMEKRGIGTGVRYVFEIGEENNNPGEAIFYLYQLKAKDSADSFNLTGNLEYNQKIQENFETKFTLDYNGSISPSEGLTYDSLKSQLILKYNKKGEDYNLKLTGKYKFSGGNSEDLDINGNITLKHNYSFSNKINSAFTITYTDKNPASQETANLELKPKWDLKYKGEGYTLNLLTQKRFDLDGDNYTEESISGIIDRLPEFTFKKKTASIGDSEIFYNIEGSLGQFYEGATEQKNIRGEYIVSLGRPFSLGKYVSITPSGVYRQDVYLTGEARYLIGGKIDLEASYNPYISTTFSYVNNKSVGPTPFNFDYISPLTNKLSAKITLKPSNKIKLDFSTSYNIITENFDKLVIKTEFDPKDKWDMNFNTSYDLNNMEWSKKINAKLDLQINEDWRIKYKGVADLEDFKLSNSVIGITRDLHCRELNINYKQATKSIWVEFFIKAFPTEKITIGG